MSFLRRQEWHSVLAFADSAQLNDDVMRSRVENYVELAMEDEKIWEVGEDECDDEEARKDLERFRQNERRLTKAMSAASNAREEIASLIAGKLLDKRVMERHLLDASDATIAILTDLSGREREKGTDDCYYSLELSREQCYPADALEAIGEENVGICPAPTITIDGEAKQLKAFAGSKAIGVNATSKNPEQYKKFLHHFHTTDHSPIHCCRLMYYQQKHL